MVSEQRLPLTMAAFLLLLCLATSRVCAFTMPLNAVAPNERSRIASKEGVLRSLPSELFYEKSREKECRPCEEPPDDDFDLSKREATFAMLGSIWAIGMLPTSLVFPTAANAAYGDATKMKLPNPAEGLIIERPQEGVVYKEAAGKLYKGLDNKVLLERLEKQSVALATIPDLVESKKWSKVSGVLAGPMGEFVQTLGQLADRSENVVAAKGSIKQIKLDLYGITAAVSKRDVDKARQNTLAVISDLVAFVKVL
jgi:hypothetical protein